MKALKVKQRIGIIISFGIGLGVSLDAHAQFAGFPYSIRTRPYSGWTPIVKGDNNTIGMGGATVALPNSIAAMEGNPAGFAMNLGGLAAQINSLHLKEPGPDHSNAEITEYQWGLGTSIPPWGFGVTYYSPSTEHVANSEVSVRELRLSAARLIGKKASVGIALQYNKGIRKFDDKDYSGSHFSFQLGVLYRLEDHWVLGASFTPAIDIAPSEEDDHISSYGFNRSIRIPSISAFGIGFMPNRFFKAGASLLAVSSTSNTALFYDQSIGVGQRYSLQPRLGASYILADFHSFKIELAVGTYYAVSRVDGEVSRLHGTFGLDVNPWFFNTGIGADLASNYKNWSVSIGIDLVRTMRTFELIPKDPVAPFDGTFPSPLKISANGLADGFTQDEPKTASPPTVSDVQKIVEDIPKRIQEKFAPSDPVHVPPSAPKIKKKKKRKQILESE